MDENFHPQNRGSHTVTGCCDGRALKKATVTDSPHFWCQFERHHVGAEHDGIATHVITLLDARTKHIITESWHIVILPRLAHSR